MLRGGMKRFLTAGASTMNKRSTILQALLALSWMWHLRPIPTLTLGCAPMSQHLTRFAELWRSWRIVGQLAVTTYLLNYSSALHLTSVKHYTHYSNASGAVDECKISRSLTAYEWWVPRLAVTCHAVLNRPLVLHLFCHGLDCLPGR